MSNKIKKIDRSFLIIVLIILTIGVLTFISSSLGIYTKNKEIFKAMMFRHVGLGVIGGLIGMFISSKINYNFWRKSALWIFLSGILITILVFIPGIGFEHGGAHRWVSLGFISFQPAELLKFATILFLSTWISKNYKKIKTFKFGFLPFILILFFSFSVLVAQPDTGSIVLIGVVSFILFWARGASIKQIIIVFFLGASFIGTYVSFNPYIIERFKTFSDINRDQYGSSYQIKQSLIAIGSGKTFGRGFGQSIQKFGPYLPESNSDSIFAIFAEEYGFVGGIILIFLYILFAFFGFRIAKKAPTIFAQNLVIGLILLTVIQVFLNIAAISAIIPLSGLPLIFMSNGGTALFITLIEMGIILNISKHRKKVISR